MKKTSLLLGVGGLVAVVAGLGSLRNKATEVASGTAPGVESLEVGFLPVTCHLTCPVTDYSTKSTTTGTRFVSKRFTSFPDVVDNIKSGRLQATFMIAPLAMK